MVCIFLFLFANLELFRESDPSNSLFLGESDPSRGAKPQKPSNLGSQTPDCGESDPTF